MSYFQLSTMKELTEQQQTTIEQYFSDVSPNHLLRASKFALDNSITPQLASQILQRLVNSGAAKFHFAVRCPECGLLIKQVRSLAEVESNCFCYGCEEDIMITTDDIEVFYTLNLPFVNRQQISQMSERSAVISDDALTALLVTDDWDWNAQFFNPTEAEYQKLERFYDSIFEKDCTAKEKGDSLEALIEYLFNLCKHFKASKKGRTKTNQLDCIVRNTAFSSFLVLAKIDCFDIECKNEEESPGVSYIQKLATILQLQDKSFGMVPNQDAQLIPHVLFFRGLKYLHAGVFVSLFFNLGYTQ